MLKRVISGGQTGVDRAALDAALEAGIAVGGWCPKGRKAEDGPIPDRYPLEECESATYDTRTRRNVEESDATLVLNVGDLDGGTAKTVGIAEQIRKPHRVVQLDVSADAALISPLLADATQISDWLRENRVGVLNVAGPRESKRPGIYQASLLFLVAVLDELECATEDDLREAQLHNTGSPVATNIVSAFCDHWPESKALFRSEAFREVVEAIVAEMVDESAAYKKTEDIVHLLIGGRDAHQIAEAINIDWDARQREAVALVRQAAECLRHPFATTIPPRDVVLKFIRDGKLTVGVDVSLQDAVQFEMASTIFVSDLLELAEQLDSCPSQTLVPDRFRSSRWDSKNIGRRGGASKMATGKSATRGMLVRELDNRIPATVINRAAIIAKLLDLSRFPGTSRQLVNSILKGGRT